MTGGNTNHYTTADDALEYSHVLSVYRGRRISDRGPLAAAEGKSPSFPFATAARGRGELMSFRIRPPKASSKSQGAWYELWPRQELVLRKMTAVGFEPTPLRTGA